MGKFIIFLIVVFTLSMLGIAVYYTASIVNIIIKRKESSFDIEKEAHNKIKEKIKEDKEL